VNRIGGGRLAHLNRLTKASDIDIYGKIYYQLFKLLNHLKFLKERILKKFLFFQIEAASRLEDEERTWLINTIGLIPNFDGPEYESQKYAVAAWKLIKAIIKSPTKSVTLSMGRDITGNPRYLKKLDHDGIVIIDLENNIKPDSQISRNFFEEVINSKGFEEKLSKVESRLEQVEKEERTRELIWSSKNKQRSWWF
jgi:hypothetical protein